MFKSLKLYKGEALDLESFFLQLVDFGYARRDRVSVEGEFARIGGTIDVYPYSFELPIRLDLDNESIASLRSFNPSTGEPLWEHAMAIVLPMRRNAASKTLHFTEEYPLQNFVDLSVGDFVVHTDYGIGKFTGIGKIKGSGSSGARDHLILEYDRQEKLYVPVEKMHLVQKYVAFQVRSPKLYRLGSKEWQRTKQRARHGVQKLAWDLITLQALRLSAHGHAFAKDTPWFSDFEKTFPFEETPDQLKALDETLRDMELPRPMDRLLCGDVGYGKTEVAMRAAFKAVGDQKQVAYLVPTTILAEQHHHTFSSRLKDFPVNVEVLCRFRTDAEQKRIIEGVAQGRVDIVIGTHRLLSDDVRFKDLGLVIIDEEQRFGVKHKEKLKSIRLSADVLTLTATPIPRTLYMSLMGAKDLSVINTPPQNRIPVKTIVTAYDEDLIRQAIVREVARKGQVFFLHNRIEDMERMKERLGKILPSTVRLETGHGQMHPKALEKIMSLFLDGEIDCLLSTMIIESGIDVPNANTIIVNDAHRFGLADLHQLRGRVGRFDRPAYSYFLVPRKGVLDSVARKRLDAIQEYSQLGSGFRIAMEDLEIRGAGNLLGLQQHGFIAAVGFDLYCRLLREAIDTFKKAGLDRNIPRH